MRSGRVILCGLQMRLIRYIGEPNARAHSFRVLKSLRVRVELQSVSNNTPVKAHQYSFSIFVYFHMEGRRRRLHPLVYYYYYYLLFSSSACVYTHTRTHTNACVYVTRERESKRDSTLHIIRFWPPTTGDFVLTYTYHTAAANTDHNIYFVP